MGTTVRSYNINFWVKLFPPDTQIAHRDDPTQTPASPSGCNATDLGLSLESKGRDQRWHACAKVLGRGVAALGSGEVAGLRGLGEE